MNDTVKRVLWTFVLAFGATFLTFSDGLLAAPNVKDAKAAISASIAAGIAAAGSYLKNRLFPPGHAAR